MNDTILVTGSSSGFGLEICKLFAGRGWTVFATVRSLKTSQLDSLKKLQKDYKTSVHIVEIDVARDDSVQKGMKHVFSVTQTIDVLINNAGFGYLGPVETFTIDEIIAQYQTNVFGTIRLTKAVAPAMRDSSGGRIINISSVNGLVTFPLYGVYSSSKFALEALSEALRFELAPFGIYVSIIEPGTFLTSFGKKRKFAKHMSDTTSAYYPWAPNFLGAWLKKGDDVKKGFLSKTMHPSRVARLVWDISQSTHPKLRYKIGLDTHFFTFFRRILPYEVWKWCINRQFSWRKTSWQ